MLKQERDPPACSEAESDERGCSENTRRVSLRHYRVSEAFVARFLTVTASIRLLTRAVQCWGIT
ncbi:MAG: hypothetical protein WBW33_37575, partial [Bryobacteraceae bacterium]